MRFIPILKTLGRKMAHNISRHSFPLIMIVMATVPWAAAEPIKVGPSVAPSHEQIQAVRKGIASLPRLINDENSALLGFRNRAEVASVVAGRPLSVYVVDLLDLRNFDPAVGSVVDLLKPMASLMYPLQTSRQDDEGGKLKTRSTLVVSQRRDKSDNTKLVWKPTNWGLKPLAEDMTKYRDTINGFSSGFVVWVPALNLHFLGDQLAETLMLVPLANRLSYGLHKGVPISGRIVFALYAREAKSVDEDRPG